MNRKRTKLLSYLSELSKNLEESSKIFLEESGEIWIQKITSLENLGGKKKRNKLKTIALCDQILNLLGRSSEEKIGKTGIVVTGTQIEIFGNG